MENVREEKKVDPRVKRTRQWLQQALLDLMAEKNFEAITVQDIAERASVNRVTFYAHFTDKYALLEYTMRAIFQKKLRAELSEGASFSPENLARLIRLVAEHLAEVQGHCPPPRGQMDTLMEKQIKAELYEVLRTWLGERSTRRSARQPTPEQAATIASWAIYGAAAQWSQKEHREPVSEFAQQVLPLIVAGLQPLAPLPNGITEKTL
ncbi:MAG: TetR/AcrR family transcriptional regulator [Anaerolineales bacterium]